MVLPSLKLICTIILLIVVVEAKGIVIYDEGRLEINGVQLFQDSNNENQYYYLPPSPSISISDKGNFEFLCIKYVGQNEDQSGGLFHALYNFLWHKRN